MRPALLLPLALFACSNKPGEPPPPVANSALPAAPPHATGAFAAGRESARPQAPQLPLDPESDEEPLEPAPAFPSDDGGTEL
jgi:hypothetical protein